MLNKMIGTFIRRPVFTTMFVLLLVVFGIKSYPNLGVDLYPDVELPLVSVTVTYTGASPEEMETLITRPIEDRVSQVAGIKTLSSTVRYAKVIRRRRWNLSWALTRARWPVRCVKRLHRYAGVCLTTLTSRLYSVLIFRHSR